MHKDMLKRLHVSHQGTEATLRRARQTMFWPGIAVDVKRNIGNCHAYKSQIVKRRRRRYTATAYQTNQGIKWAVDIFTHKSSNYLVITDYFSDYFDFEKLTDMSAPAVVDISKRCETGYPTMCAFRQWTSVHNIQTMDLSSQHSDNGPQFTTFRQWTSVHNIQTMDLSSQHSDNGPQFTTFRQWTSVHNIQTMHLSSQHSDNGPQFTTFRQWTLVHNIQTMDLSSQHSDNGPQFTTFRQCTSVHNIQTMDLSSQHTDNGPQFTAHEFAVFSANWESEHKTSSPYHSQSNGKAESSVKLKRMLTRAADPQLVLLECRSTITAGMTTSPIQRLFNRSTRSTLPQRECISMEDKVNQAEKRKQRKTMYHYNKREHEKRSVARQQNRNHYGRIN